MGLVDCQVLVVLHTACRLPASRRHVTTTLYMSPCHQMLTLQPSKTKDGELRRATPVHRPVQHALYVLGHITKDQTDHRHEHRSERKTMAMQYHEYRSERCHFKCHAPNTTVHCRETEQAHPAASWFIYKPWPSYPRSVPVDMCSNFLCYPNACSLHFAGHQWSWSKMLASMNMMNQWQEFIMNMSHRARDHSFLPVWKNWFRGN